MRAYHRSRRFAVDVQIADVELTLRNLDLVAVVRVHRSSQSEFSVVADAQSVLEIAARNHRQHRTEDLFLRDARHRIDVRDHRWLDVEAVALGATATRDDTSLTAADLDVLEDGAH